MIGFVDGARRLKRAWFSRPGMVGAVNAAFDRIGFTEKYLRSLAVGAASQKGKAIKDSVWGMMEFSAADMRLIDSPLLQRLRRIHQLGFSYLTYPSAEHSRFVHSIGMAHVVSRFVASVDREHDAENGALVDGAAYIRIRDLAPLRASDLIHAALLHDSGHLPFSHAAESAIVATSDKFRFAREPYSNFQGLAERHLEKAVSLSETLSIFLVLSPRFCEFYNDYVCKGIQDTDAVLRIACLIAGQPPVERCRNIQHIISSSAVDADKIDYVSRDALACGIPVGVDASRFYQGSSLLKLDEKAAAKLGCDGEEGFVFALNASGWDTFDEIIRSRSTLYQRVYLHPVTRTAEALFSRALQLNVAAVQPGEPQALLADAVSLWTQSDVSALDLLCASADPGVEALGTEIRDRRLPKKACSARDLRPRQRSWICAVKHLPLDRQKNGAPSLRVAKNRRMDNQRPASQNHRSLSRTGKGATLTTTDTHAQSAATGQQRHDHHRK